MKKKSRILLTCKRIFAFLFVFSLISPTNISAEVAPFKINAAEIAAKSSSVEGSIDSFTENEIKNSIIFHHLNDEVTFVLSLKNNLSSDITIQSITDDNANRYIAYEYDQHANEIIKAGEDFVFNVRAVYENELTDLSQRAQPNNIKFTINFLENEEEKSAQIGINPNTGDSINWNCVLLVISTVGLILCAIFKKKKSNKVVVVILAAAIIAPVAKAASFTYNFTLSSNYNIRDKQKITYIVDNEEAEITEPYGSPAEGLEAPEKRGYTFAGWTFEDGSDFDPSAPITDDLTIYANYSLDNYTVRYDLNGGEVAIANKTDYTINDTFTLNNPTKAHYNFVGWTGTGLSNPTKDVTVSGETGSREYVANYAPIDYRISYSGLTEAEEDTLNNLTTYNIETSEFSLNNPANRTDADGDVTEIFAGWKEGASTSMTVSLPNQNSLGDKVFEATWTTAEPTTYTIGYELNGGTLSVENATSFTKFTETFTLNNPSKTGYSFIGWTGSNGTTPQKEVKVEKGTRHALHFAANYEPNKYSVIFDKNATNASGEMTNQTLTYDTESLLNNNQFVRAGYSFAGWNTKKDNSGTHYDNQARIKNLAASGGVALYAEWEANTYEIAFDANTGAGAMSNLVMTYDVEKNLPANTFAHTTHAFNGWNTNKDGSGTSYSDQAKVKNLATSGTITLYAQWKRQALYTVAKIGDYVKYIPTVASYNISGDSSYCYYGPTDKANGNGIDAMSVSPSSVTSWRVVSKDDSAKTVTLVPATSGGTVTMNGRGYGCYEDNLSRISAQFKDNTFAASSSYMTEANYQLVKKSGVGIIDNAAIGKKEMIASGSNLDYYVYYSLNNNSERFEIANQRTKVTSLTPEYSFFDKEFNILPLVTIKTGILVNSGSGTSASPWMMTTE